jgi:RNA-directed DNA polymerase
MNGRKQKTEQDTCQRKDRAELEGYEGGQTFLWMAEKGDTNTEMQGQRLLEFILAPGNNNEAYKSVKRNARSGGIDGMQTDELRQYLQNHRDELITALQQGRYRPNPVKRVEICLFQLNNIPVFQLKSIPLIVQI